MPHEFDAVMNPGAWGQKQMSKFQMYDVVRVVEVPASWDLSFGFRAPSLGDLGAVVMVYDSPQEGYTVEGVGVDGRTEWMAEFKPGQLEQT